MIRPLDYELVRRLGSLCNETRPSVLFAAAVTSHAPTLGNTCTDLAKLSLVPTSSNPIPPVLEKFFASLPKTVSQWEALLIDSPLIGSPSDCTKPFILDEDLMYLNRYFAYQKQVAQALFQLANRPVQYNAKQLQASLAREFPKGPIVDGEFDFQYIAGLTSVLRNLTIIGGGPGTGKTFTVLRILGILIDQYENVGQPHSNFQPRILLLAPTGKAAARMSEAIAESWTKAPPSPTVQQAIPSDALTIHKALGFTPSKPTKVQYNRSNPLKADIVVVDEASMIDIALMNGLLQALPPHCRLILLGDPDQLASVDAGSVLSDLCANPTIGHPISQAFADVIQPFLEKLPPQYQVTSQPGIGDCLVRLAIPRRFNRNSGIYECAKHLNQGDGQKALQVLRNDQYSDVQLTSRKADGLLPQTIIEQIVSGFQPAIQAAQQGDILQALRCLENFRILCALKKTRNGIESINQEVTHLLLSKLSDLGSHDSFYPGRPILITQNDPYTGLSNGDIGIVIPIASHSSRPIVKVAFNAISTGGEPRLFPISRIPAHQTVYAMTIHKSQGSQFKHVMIFLPEIQTPILSKELLYTGITRARKKLTIVSPQYLTNSLNHPIQDIAQQQVNRLSGLTNLVWGHKYPRASEPSSNSSLA